MSDQIVLVPIDARESILNAPSIGVICTNMDRLHRLSETFLHFVLYPEY
jgi:hypothetical protein